MVGITSYLYDTKSQKNCNTNPTKFEIRIHLYILFSPLSNLVFEKYKKTRQQHTQN